MDEKRELNKAIIEQYPDLIDGYDTENNMWKLNEEMVNRAIKSREELQEISSDLYHMQTEQHQKQVEEYQDSAKRLDSLFSKRASLKKALDDESASTEENAKKKEDLAYVEEAIIRVIGDFDKTLKDSSDKTKQELGEQIAVFKETGEITTETIKAIINALNAKADTAERSARRTARWDRYQAQQALISARQQIAAYQAIIETRAMLTAQDRAEMELERRQEEFKPWQFWRIPELLRLEPVTHELGMPRETVDPVRDDAIEQMRRLEDEAEKWQSRIGELDAELREMEEGLGDIGGDGGAIDKTAGATRSLNDILNEFIATTLRAAEVQGMLNDAYNRERSLFERRIGYYTRDGAAMWERVQAWRDEAEVAGLARKEQKGVEEQARLLRDAQSRLIERQSTLNLSTEEGRDYYYRLEDQIESLKNQINSLSIEWFNLQEAQQIGIPGLERIRTLRQANIDFLGTELDYLTRAGASQEELARAEGIRSLKLEQLTDLEQQYKNQINEQREIRERSNRELERGNITQAQHNQTLVETATEIARLQGLLRGNATEMENLSRATDTFNDHMSDLRFHVQLGVMSLQEMVAATRQAYGVLGELTDDEQRKKILELTGYYRDKFNDIKRIAEESYRDQLRALDRSVEAEIEIIQRKIDALDEAAKDRSREEDYRKHQDTMRDLTEKRLYHEQRTGIEHQQAIADIDRDMDDERRRWALQQDQWYIQDRRASYEQQIQDIRDAAEAQRKQLEKAYQEMQSDFDDHNINMLAVASAYDEGFFQDAKRKGELWITGFRTGILSGIGGMDDLLGRATGIIPSYTQADRMTTDRGGTIRPVSQFSITDGRIDATLGQDVFAGDIIRTAGGDYQVVADSSDPRGFVGKKVPTAHTGAMTAGAGLAELIPGEMIFPPDLSAQLQKLLKVVATSPKAGREVEGGRTISVNRLLHAENVHIDDKPDMVLLSRELRRQLSNIE